MLPPGIQDLRTLDQGWTDGLARDYYNTTQGSQMMPYDWFLHLERADATTLFREAANLQRLGYLPRHPDESGNPDGLPVGFARDGEFVGLTCSACHTGVIEYGQTAWIIDGGPTMADASTMMFELVQSLQATHDDAAKFDRFAANVLEVVDETTKRELKADLEAVIDMRARYNTRNLLHSGEGAFGPGRLDAFGAILNEVAVRFAQTDNPPGPVDAPVSYPFLWDTPQHDYVQWNGSAKNTTVGILEPLVGTSHVGALGRNIGEVVGVFGDVDTSEEHFLSGYPSSVKKQNLIELEEWIRQLFSPRWPTEFGVPDPVDVAAGRLLFEKNCMDCHQDIDRRDWNRKVVAQMRDVGTDLTMARNVATRTCRSGVFEGRRSLLPPFKKIGAEAPVGTLLEHIGQRVLLGSKQISEAQELPFAFLIHAHVGSGANRTAVTLSNFEVQNGQLHSARVRSARHLESGAELDLHAGEAKLDGVGEKFAARFRRVEGDGHAVHRFDFAGDDARVESKLLYKGRPLNGIWATAPYLHNGSVPNIDELLKPPAERVKSFRVGSRQYDPEHMGFVMEGDFTFETEAQPGNSNAGHDYGDRVFTADERRQLIEYLKTL